MLRRRGRVSRERPENQEDTESASSEDDDDDVESRCVPMWLEMTLIIIRSHDLKSSLTKKFTFWLHWKSQIHKMHENDSFQEIWPQIWPQVTPVDGEWESKNHSVLKHLKRGWPISFRKAKNPFKKFRAGSLEIMSTETKS